jgi:hypothetical protein
MPGDWRLPGGRIRQRIRQPLQDRLGGPLEGSSGLLFPSQMLINNCRRPAAVPAMRGSIGAARCSASICGGGEVTK